MALAVRTCVIIKQCKVSFQLSWCLITSIRHASNAHSQKLWKKMTREERYMKKLVEGLNQTKRRKDVYLQKLAFASNDDKSRITVSPGMVRRANQLSAVIHENIFYCFCYEDICPDLLQYNLEISKVKITPDLNNLNVYWNATGNKETDDEIEQLLKASRGKLRSALTKKRIINRVPPIQFIKDIKSASAKHVDDLLSRADMGNDQVVSDSSSDLPLKLDLSSYKSSTSSPEADIKQLGNRFLSDKYTLRDGPGAKLVVSGNADFGASSTFYSDKERMSQEMQSAGDAVDDWNPDVAELHSTQDSELKLRLRNDIYDLDHATLLAQVLHMKKKLKERGNLPETETSRRRELFHLKSRHLDSGNLDSKRIHKLLKESMRRSRHKVYPLDDVPMREDWQNEQLKLIKNELAVGDNWQDDDDDSDGILEEFDYNFEQEANEK